VQIRLPGVGTSGSGPNSPWNATSNVRFEDGSYASSLLQPSGTTNVLYATNFGFAVPAAATIDGVLVRKRNMDVGGGLQMDAFYLVNGIGTPIGDDKCVNMFAGCTGLSGAFTDEFWGSPSELWGAALSPAIVNAAGFGVGIQYVNPNAGTGEIRVETFEIRVHYTGGVTHFLSHSPQVFPFPSINFLDLTSALTLDHSGGCDDWGAEQWRDFDDYCCCDDWIDWIDWRIWGPTGLRNRNRRHCDRCSVHHDLNSNGSRSRRRG
jgi:hypothetical protein